MRRGEKAEGQRKGVRIGTLAIQKTRIKVRERGGRRRGEKGLSPQKKKMSVGAVGESRKAKRGRKSNRYSDESDSDVTGDSSKRHKRKSIKATSHSDSDATGSDHLRLGRDKKRSGKKGRKHHCEDDD